MSKSKIDKSLDDVFEDDAVKERLIQEDGNIKIPGTPLIMPGRGVAPREGEYVDVNASEGVTNDPNKIDALKAKDNKALIDSELIGTFDGRGVYKLSDDIAAELVQMVKVIDSEIATDDELKIEELKVSVPNLVYTSSASEFSGLGKFKFAIQTFLRNSIAVSELFLLEDIKKVDGFIQNVNIYSVGKFRDEFNQEYKKKMYKHFNVVSKEIALKMNEEEKLLFGWVYRRKLYVKQLKELGNTKFLLAEANYFAAKMQALSELGAFGTNILSSFNDLKEKAEGLLKKELNARDLNDLLDMLVDNLSENYREMGKQYYIVISPATKRFQQEITQIIQTNKETAKAKTLEKTKWKPLELKDGKARKLKGAKADSISLKKIPIQKTQSSIVKKENNQTKPRVLEDKKVNKPEVVNDKSKHAFIELKTIILKELPLVDSPLVDSSNSDENNTKKQNMPILKKKQLQKNNSQLGNG